MFFQPLVIPMIVMTGFKPIDQVTPCGGNGIPWVGLLTRLHLYLGEAGKYTISETEPVDSRGRYDVIIQFENFFRARESILNFGNAAEVLEPEALKLNVIDFARQIVNSYHAI